MKLTAPDYRYLRVALILLSLSLLIGVTAVYIAYRSLLNESIELDQQTQLGKQVRSRLTGVKAEKIEIERLLQRVRQIERQGFIGPESRLEWAERIRKIREKRKLLRVDYELSPQHQIDPALIPTMLSGSHHFLASTMSLRMELLHAQDFLVFLRDLARGANALLVVRDCSVGRTGLLASPDGRTPLLVADCTLDWVTIRSSAPAL